MLINKYQAWSQYNLYDNEILDEFDYWSNWTGTTGVIALELGKIAAFDFVCSLASTNINQSAPNLVTMYMSIRSQMSLIMGKVIPDQSGLSALEIKKFNFNSLFGIHPHC